MRSSISCGWSFNMALTKDGQLYTFGRNEAGQCGVGVSLTLDQYSMEPAPVKVLFVDDADGDRDPAAPRMVTAKCAYKHTLSIDSDGHMWTWGQGKWLKPNLMTGDDGWMTSKRFDSPPRPPPLWPRSILMYRARCDVSRCMALVAYEGALWWIRSVCFCMLVEGNNERWGAYSAGAACCPSAACDASGSATTGAPW
jgi:hypothetical protein